MSHAQKHFQRVTAQLQAQSAGVVKQAGDLHNKHRTQYEKMLLLLDTHQQQLRQIQSIEKRAELKAQFLPEYDAYITGLLEAGTSPQDDVLVTLMMWNFDCDNFERALVLAEYALTNNMAMPERFKRTLGCVIAEETADAMLKNNAFSAQEKVDLLLKTQQLTTGQDMPDEVRAKLLKALGYAQRDCGQLPQALASLEEAVSKHTKVGVKKDIESLQRQIKKAGSD